VAGPIADHVRRCAGESDAHERNRPDSGMAIAVTLTVAQAAGRGPCASLRLARALMPGSALVAPT
jgi:hypothetical protein